MAVILNSILTTVYFFAIVSDVCSVSPPFVVPCGQCPTNEVLRQSPPSCEPTCYEDCYYSQGSVQLVHKPTCVCKPGFVRDNGVCIPKGQCFVMNGRTSATKCKPSEELQNSPPCCEPSCDNDCSNILCSLVFVEKPTCVCKTGLVRHNGVCINPRDCPPEEQSEQFFDNYAVVNDYVDINYMEKSASGAAVCSGATPQLPCQTTSEPCVQETTAPTPCVRETPSPVPCQPSVPCLLPPSAAPDTPCTEACLPLPPVAPPNPCGACKQG